MTENAAERRSWFRVREVSIETAAPKPTFQSVYDECFDLVWRSAIALGVSVHEADDVVQEVFVVVHKKLPRFEGRSSVRTWVTGIMLNTVREYRRAHRHDRDAVEVDVRLVSPALSPEASAQNRDSAELLARILRGMSDEQRIVFILSELEEMSAPEIASALDVNTNTVYSRLRLARAEVDRYLARIRLSQGGDAP